MDQHVSTLDEPKEDGESFVVQQIYRHASLIAVQFNEGCALIMLKGRPPCPGNVSRQRLHLHHQGAGIAQVLCALGTSDPLSDIHDGQALQCRCHWFL